MTDGGETIFTKIIKGEIPAKIEFENERILAFHDVNPQAPLHVLIIPKKPLRDLDSAKPEDQQLMGELLLTAAEIAAKLGLNQHGYRLVINTGAEAGQTVFHLHLHLLGGRSFTWPPG